MGEEFDDEYEIKCTKCKKISEKTINQRTNKPYTICENCRLICGKRGGEKVKITETKKDNIDDKGNEWKKILFGAKQESKTKNSTIYNSISENDIETDEENSEKSINNDNDNDKSNVFSSGELIVGKVENVDNIKKDLTTLSLNDKVEYIIDLLETRNKAKNDNSINDNNKNDDVIYEGFNKIVDKLKTLNEAVDKMNNDIQKMKTAII